MKIARRRDPVVVPKEPDCWWCSLFWIGVGLFFLIVVPGKLELLAGLAVGFMLGATVILQVFGQAKDERYE